MENASVEWVEALLNVRVAEQKAQSQMLEKTRNEQRHVLGASVALLVSMAYTSTNQILQGQRP